MNRGLALLLVLFAWAASVWWGIRLGAVSIGSEHIRALLHGIDDSAEALILWQLRIPRVLLAGIVGAGLAAAGAAYQGLFRNPLADPFVIGASGGAALGATIAIVAGWSAGEWGFAPVQLCAFAGTLGAVALVYLLGGLGALASPLTLLLAGAAVSTVLGALVSLLMILDDRSLQVIFSWLLGGLGGRGWGEVQVAALGVLPALAGLWLLARPLDALSLGADVAESLGLPMRRARVAVVLLASLMTAAAVAVAGIIGFVGLLAPHAARLLFGARHRLALPLSAVCGAILLIWADLAARTLFAPVEVPVGIMTALMGGPFFLILLRWRSRIGLDRP